MKELMAERKPDNGRLFDRPAISDTGEISPVLSLPAVVEFVPDYRI